jgi:hypothetical protein
MRDLVCTACRARLLVPLGHSGTTYPCPFCGKNLPIPAPQRSEPPPPSDAPDHAPAEESVRAGAPPQHPGHFESAPASAVTAPVQAGGVPPRLITYVVLGVAALGVLFAVLVLLARNVKNTADRTLAMNHMKQIALGCLAHHDIHKSLPTPSVLSSDGETVALSWRVTILPYIEEQPLFKTFDEVSGWDSPENKALLDKMPSVFVDPLRQRETPAPDFQKTPFQTTHFQMFTGPGTAFPDNEKVKLGTGLLPSDFLFAEAAQDVPWTKPADMVVRADQPLPMPTGTVLAAFCDGTVRSIERDAISDEKLRWYLRASEGPAPPLD